MQGKATHQRNTEHLGKAVCPLCGAQHGSRIGSKRNGHGTPCNAKLDDGSLCSHVFTSGHERTRQQKMQRIEAEKSKSSRWSGPPVKGNEAATEFETKLQHQADLFQAKHGGSVYVAWCTSINNDIKQPLRAGANVWVDEHETLKPAVKSSAALFHHCTQSSIDPLSARAVFESNYISTGLQTVFKAKSLALHKAIVHASIQATKENVCPDDPST